MLEKLCSLGARVFDVDLSADKSRLTITEACDNCFEAQLTKEQVVELAYDFLRIASVMTEN